MPKFILDYFKHIAEETAYIIEQDSFISKDDFYRDATLKRAIVRSLEIIGEATKNIPDEFRNEHTEIDWKNIARMRDKLIHHYFGIDYSIVWDVMTSEIKPLHEKIKVLIEKEETQE